MGWVLCVVLVGAGLFGFDRGLLAAERAGYLFYRKKKPAPGAIGSALMQVQGLFEPGKVRIAEVKRAEPAEVAEQGEGESGVAAKFFVREP